MTGHAATLTIPASRPKVHRLPPKACVSHRQRMMATVLNYSQTARLVFTGSSLALALVLSALFFNEFSPLAAIEREARNASGLIGTVTVSEAIASTVLAKEQAIVLPGQDGNKIVGQLVRMSQPGSGASAIISEVDKRRGQELLSIVNRAN